MPFQEVLRANKTVVELYWGYLSDDDKDESYKSHIAVK
jgi:hypothetical protein